MQEVEEKGSSKCELSQANELTKINSKLHVHPRVKASLRWVIISTPIITNFKTFKWGKLVDFK